MTHDERDVIAAAIEALEDILSAPEFGTGEQHDRLMGVRDSLDRLLSGL